MTDTALATPAPAWVPFWFETNAIFGPVRNRADWLKMIAGFARGHNCTLEQGHALFMERARFAVYHHPETLIAAGNLPSVGLRREHMDGEPFAAWAEKHNLDVSLPTGDAA